MAVEAEPAASAVVPTASVAIIPASLWPGTVHQTWYEPFGRPGRLSVALAPAAIMAV
jgi:hypothetical protein